MISEDRYLVNSGINIQVPAALSVPRRRPTKNVLNYFVIGMKEFLRKRKRGIMTVPYLD